MNDENDKERKNNKEENGMDIEMIQNDDDKKGLLIEMEFATEKEDSTCAACIMQAIVELLTQQTNNNF